MSNWLLYGIYIVAGISILFAIGGLKGYVDTKDRGLLLSSIVSVGFSVTAIVLPHWWPILAGFAVNIFVSRIFPKYAHSLLPPLSKRHESASSSRKVPDESEFEELVARQLEGIMPPTDVMGIRPSEYVRGLMTELVVPIDVLIEKVEFSKKRVVAGPSFDRVAREVMFRWLSMEPEHRSDGTYLMIPDHLASVLSTHIPAILLRTQMKVFCEQCDKWCDSVEDVSVRKSSSQVHAAGQERYTCPSRHVVYESDYNFEMLR